MYHTIIIAGNVGQDAEMRFTPSGQAVASFSVATNREYTLTSGEKKKETIWFRISAWGKQAEICQQYVKKGMKVLVEGRLTPDDYGNPRVWTGKDGVAKANFEVTSSIIRFLSSRGDYQEAPEKDAGDIPEDELPF